MAKLTGVILSDRIVLPLGPSMCDLGFEGRAACCLPCMLSILFASAVPRVRGSFPLNKPLFLVETPLPAEKGDSGLLPEFRPGILDSIWQRGLGIIIALEMHIKSTQLCSARNKPH